MFPFDEKTEHQENERINIKNLIKATEILSSGGATYAKALDNCVAFGAMFPFDEKTEHQENERINIKNLIKATEIYALAVYRLLCL